MSLEIKATAVILIANEQGLIELKIPSRKTVRTGKLFCLFTRRLGYS